MKHLMTFLILMATVAFSAAGQVSPKIAEPGWLELPAFSEDLEHFFVSHYTDEYWGKQRNYSLFWDQERQIPIWVAYPLIERLIGKGKRSGAWQYDKFMATKKQPNLKRTYQEGSVDGYIRGYLASSGSAPLKHQCHSLHRYGEEHLPPAASLWTVQSLHHYDYRSQTPKTSMSCPEIADTVRLHLYNPPLTY